MKTVIRQLRLIIWKNYLVRKRQKVRLTIEIVWPLLLFLLLMWVRTRGLRDFIEECHVSPKVFPSSGVLAFSQNWFCSFNNTCYPSEEEARISPANLSIARLQEMGREIAAALSNSSNTVVSDREGSAGLNSLMTAVLEVDRLAALARRVNSSNYVPKLLPLSALLSSVDNLAEELKPFNFSDNELDALLQTRLSNETYNFTGYSLLLENPPGVACQNIPEQLSSNDSLVNLRLCSLTPEEMDQVRSVLNSRWDPKFDKSLVKEFIQAGLQEEISFNDLNEALNLYNNLTQSSQALPEVKDAFSAEGAVVGSFMRMASDRTTVDSLYNILNKYLCNKASLPNASISIDNKIRLEEFKEKYRLRQKSNYMYDNSTSKFCNDVFRGIESNPLARVFWRTYKHFVLGQILYTPVTPTTNRIMKRINETYFQFHLYRKLFENPIWSSLFPAGAYVENFANNLKLSQEFLKSRAVLAVLKNKGEENSTDSVVSNLENGESLLRSALEENRSNATGSIWDCMEYEKVRGIDNVEQAEAVADGLLQFNRLWALVVFESEIPDSGGGKPGIKNRSRREVNTIPISEREFSPLKMSKRELSKGSTSVKNTSQTSTDEPPLKPMTIYKIRMSSEFVDNTEFIKDRMDRPMGRYRPMFDIKYVTFGFAYLQDMIDRSIISEQTGTPIDQLPGTMLQQYPYPCYIDDQFIKAISRTFPLFMVLAWIFTCSMIVKSIVYEKELRLKQTMQVMGLRNFVFWIGWFIDSLLPMIVTIFILTFILVWGKVLLYSSVTVIFAFLFLYCLSTIFASFLISVFFSRANIAAACGGIIFFIIYLPFPFMVRWILYFTPTLKSLACLSSNVALGLGASYIAEFEEQGVGLQWYNITKSPIYDDNYSIGWVMVMMIVDCFVYFILTWYIEAVLPGQYGIPLPWYFPFTKSYWCGPTPASKLPSGKNNLESNGSLHTNSGISKQDSFETEPTRLYAGVQIKNLTKVYGNGKVAVDDLSMNFYEDQITSFLGHNGAGKTTTISILTGLYPPTSGTAIICGYDIRTDIAMVRKSLGMCPQHNVLFNRLTVLEHLQFYGFLRGSDESEVAAEFEQMLVDLDLPDKRFAYPGDLSGGMQRKLSVALAFIGGSRVVILDEPTSGVDPYSRRSIWELLLKYKKGRTVILTTHYMDEADLLGDRIGIISKGSMKCCGTSLFLKNKYGSGYTLTVELNPEPLELPIPTPTVEISETSQPIQHTSNEDLPITKMVKRFVPQAVISAKFGNEITFVLTTKDSKVLERLCSTLDDDLIRLNALSYGVSDTSLEEIFLRITDDDLTEERNQTKSSLKEFIISSLSKKPSSNQAQRDEKVVRLKGTNVTYNQVPVRIGGEHVAKKPTNKYLRQFLALHAKRFHHTKRNVKALFSELVLPPVLVAIALAVLSLAPMLRERPPLTLSPSVYGAGLNFFTKTVGKPANLMTDYRQSIYDEYGLGIEWLNYGEAEKSCQSQVETFNNSNYKVPVCSCSTGSQICPSRLDEPPPPYHKIVSGDYVYDMDNIDVSAWIISTTKKYKHLNLGGFEFGVNLTTNDLPLVRLKRLNNIGRLFDSDIARLLPDSVRNSTNNIKVWFNNKAWVSSVANMNAINNNVLRVLVQRNGSRPQPWGQYGIVTINHPMNFTSKQLDVEMTVQSGFSLLQAISVIFALSFVTASFLLYLIEERISNSKHLQLVSGVNRLTYWVQAYTWDMGAYLVSAALCIFVFLMFDSAAYTSKESFPAFILLFVLYGWSCIPMMYPASFLFDVPSSAFVAMGCGNMFIGIITTITTSVLSSFPDEDLRHISKILSEVFLIFPHFCLGDGMIKLSVHHFSMISLSQLDLTLEADVFEWNFLGKNLFCMFLLGIFFFLVTLCIEFRVFSTIVRFFMKNKEELNFAVGDEEDVALERKRVHNQPNDLLVIKDLSKKYRRKATPSVNKICVGVKRGECFGLLGLNGAGKTTTFKMLTGETRPTGGEATVGGFSIHGGSINDVRALLGYCPQFDALDPLLTPYEHLVFYARVRNIPSDALQTRVDRLIRRMALGHYRNRLAGDLSGGNKRKLSTAIALLGNPPLVFLDEPTTGMDPKARRFLWNCISDVVKEGGCVILTSHSMEECQALCTRLTIMVNGQFTCLGSSQHLKNKYGKGYLLIIRCSENAKEDVKSFMSERLTSSKITEEHYTQLRYEVPISRLSTVLQEMETAKSQGIVIDYSVTQTTLEEVFLRFAREQADPNDRKPKANLFGCCTGCLGKGHKGSNHVTPKHEK
ncbi:ATP-Hypothetical protein cassette sub-family A ABC1 member [Nesidiocoris tenuis]|uniref:ABC transporter domain-containing protein n=1 Tax=Nesidiocoris tenuis TaxID=355587 RepID=A0ABN7AAX4_9HEMI|nr:ATP-Hypothetical protein cassette sub-family A ABC1 member [Nesidiocoris tenuis]